MCLSYFAWIWPLWNASTQDTHAALRLGLTVVLQAQNPTHPQHISLVTGLCYSHWDLLPSEQHEPLTGAAGTIRLCKQSAKGEEATTFQKEKNTHFSARSAHIAPAHQGTLYRSLKTWSSTAAAVHLPGVLTVLNPPLLPEVSVTVWSHVKILIVQFPPSACPAISLSH